MNIRDFFNSPVMVLPRKRTDPDFLHFLVSIFNDYQAAINTLDKSCHLCKRIYARKADIQGLARYVSGAVCSYLEGDPARAYTHLEHGLNFVSQNLQSLFTLPLDQNALKHLYRIVYDKSYRKGVTIIPKSRLFHCPFNLRHKVLQHRYGIPGFPCLYLGGSIDVCQSELRIVNNKLPFVAVAEFAPRTNVKLLNFGYRPSVLTDIAMGSSLCQQGANPSLEQFIIDYTVCWPLLAAASIQKVVYDDEQHFFYEYIVPQMILQWIMRTTDCDGIRYFSTRWAPISRPISDTINYVFPAKPPAHANYSQPLLNKFSFTDVHMWRTTTAGQDPTKEHADNIAILRDMPKSPLL